MAACFLLQLCMLSAMSAPGGGERIVHQKVLQGWHKKKQVGDTRVKVPRNQAQWNKRLLAGNAQLWIA